MNKNQVRELFQKIQINYPNFEINEIKMNEWHKELKDYDYNEILEKLDEHFRSEKYGRQEPKVYFLTKGLIKVKDKIKREGIKIRCSICGGSVLLNDFNKHYDRCSSVEYLNSQNLKYFGKEINKEKYMNMNDKEFSYKYDKFCEYVLQNTRNKKEIECLEHYFIGR